MRWRSGAPHLCVVDGMPPEPVFVSSELHVLPNVGSYTCRQISSLPEQSSAESDESAENAAYYQSSDTAAFVPVVSNAGANYNPNDSRSDRLLGTPLKVGGELSALAKPVFSSSHSVDS